MRRLSIPHIALLVMILSSSLSAAQAAARKTRPLPGTLVRTLDNRVTVFYEFKTKDGQVHKAAAVSKTVLTKVVKPAKPPAP